MRWDDAAGAWEPVATVRMPAEATLWLVECALAVHASTYYLRLRTYKAGAPDAARVRVLGPFADGGSARATVQDLIREARRDLVGVVCPARAQETRAGGPDSPQYCL